MNLKVILLVIMLVAIISCNTEEVIPQAPQPSPDIISYSEPGDIPGSQYTCILSDVEGDLHTKGILAFEKVDGRNKYISIWYKNSKNNKYTLFSFKSVNLSRLNPRDINNSVVLEASKVFSRGKESAQAIGLEFNLTSLKGSLSFDVHQYGADGIITYPPQDRKKILLLTSCSN